MVYSFSTRSLNNLSSVHPDLVRLLKSSLNVAPYDFGIIEGLRTLEKERQEVATGKSETLNSRHLADATGYCYAVDFICYDENNQGTWKPEYYQKVSEVFKRVSKQLNIPIVWGGDWKTLKDLDHLELDSKVYPTITKVVSMSTITPVVTPTPVPVSNPPEDTPMFIRFLIWVFNLFESR